MVTDEQVKRALLAYWRLDELPPPAVTSHLGARMRVALEAAEGDKPAEGEGLRS